MKRQTKSKNLISNLPQAASNGNALRAWLKDGLENQFSSALMDAVPALVVVLDLDGRIVLFNRFCRERTGFNVDEVRGRLLCVTLLAPDEVGAAKGVLQALREEASPRSSENYWLCKRGDRRLISWYSCVVGGPDAKARWIIGTGVDVTELKRDREALRDSVKEV